MGINWDLAGPPVNVLQSLAVLGHAQEQRRQQDERDKAAEFEHRLASAYNISTGKADPIGVRQAFVGAGDTRGAMQFDQQNAAHSASEKKAMAEPYAQAIMDVLKYPPAERAARFDAYATEFAKTHPEAEAFIGHYNDQFAHNFLAETGHLDDFNKSQEPKAVPITAGGEIGFVQNGQRVDRPQGPVAAPTTKQEYDQLPPGSPYVAPDGSHRVKGGSAPGQGNFPVNRDAAPVSNGRSVIENIFPGVHVTDSVRDPNSALGRANPGSYHNKTAAAVDVRPIPGMSFEQYVASIKAKGYSIIEAIDEVKHPSAHATGPHWHVVIGERG